MDKKNKRGQPKNRERPISKDKFEELCKKQYNKKTISKKLKVSTKVLDKWCRETYNKTFAKVSKNVDRVRGQPQGGRPTVFTDETLQKLKEAFMIGANIKEASLHADVSPSTIYNKMYEDEEFKEKVEQWQSCLHYRAKKVLSNAIDSGDTRVALDVLKHTSPDYKETKALEVSGKDGGEIRFVWGDDDGESD